MVAFVVIRGAKLKVTKKIKKNPATAGSTYFTREIIKYFVTDSKKINSVLLLPNSCEVQVAHSVPDLAIFSAETLLAPCKSNRLPAVINRAKRMRKYRFGFITVV